MHVIARSTGAAVEIQIRTSLQHLWAELSEKLADVFDPSIKYGGGEEEIRSMLADTSDLIGLSELLESEVSRRQQRGQLLNWAQEKLLQLRTKLGESLKELIAQVERIRKRNDLPD